MIGRQAIKLRETEKIIQRFFKIEEAKVSRPKNEDENDAMPQKMADDNSGEQKEPQKDHNA
jgi:hypothetical protein